MINADKYKISVEESDRMSDEFEKWHQENPDVRGYGEALYRFLQAKTKPILSEDEKVILRHRPLDFEYIGRDSLGLYISQFDDRAGSYCYWSFTNVFNNIAKGEGYKISDLLEEYR